MRLLFVLLSLSVSMGLAGAQAGVAAAGGLWSGEVQGFFEDAPEWVETVVLEAGNEYCILASGEIFSGTAPRDCGGCRPEGGCWGIAEDGNPEGRTWLAPGLLGYALIGRICGEPVDIHCGVGFVPPCTGVLELVFNDTSQGERWEYFDNSGQFDVTILSGSCSTPVESLGWGRIKATYH